MRPTWPNILPLQLLVVGPCWPTLILPIPPNIVPLLSRIVRGQTIIAPVAHKPHPPNRMALVIRGKVAMARQVGRRGVVCELVDICVQRGIPERATVAAVHEHAHWQVPVRDRVGVRPGSHVVGVGAQRGVGDRAGPVVMLLDDGVGEGFARGVLRVPECSGLAVLEADHVVFPSGRNGG